MENTSCVLKDYPYLQSLHVESESCINVNEFHIANCPLLERIVVDEWVMNGQSCSFIVEHCPLLKEIILGNNSLMYTSLCKLESRSEEWSQ